MDMRKLIKTILFVVIGLLVLRKAEDILEKKWSYPGDYEEVPKIINEFYSLKEGSLEAVFLGKSSVKLAVSPIQIYENSSIVTYNLASSAQPIQLSYYLLKEVFRKQSPQIIFLDASELFRSSASEDYSWHFIMDNVPMSRNKIEAAVSYTDEKEGRDFLSMMCPLYYYHDRWDELTRNDFEKQEETDYYYAAGQYMTSLVSGTGLIYENVNAEVAAMNRQKGCRKEYTDHIYQQYEMEDKLYEVTLNQEVIEYIRKMKVICEEHNAKLVLLKVPTMGMPQINYISWSQDKYRLVKELCQEMGVTFFDMVYDTAYEAEIDWQKDTIDGGAHLNIRGAEKVTSCITAYLEEQGLEKRIDELYYQCTRDYERVHRICMLQSESDLTEYIRRILEDENYTIIISAQSDFQASLSEDDLDAFMCLGLQSCLTHGVRDSFIGVIDRGEVIYESISNRKSFYKLILPGGGEMEVTSSGLNTGSYSSIKIDGKEHSTNMQGLNFVIWDNRTDLVVDSVNFNTSLPGAAAYRNKGVILDYLAKYKHVINAHKE